MQIKFFENLSNFDKASFGSFGKDGDLEAKAKMLGMSVEDYIKLKGEENSDKKAESEKASENDSFVKTATEKKEEKKEVKTEKETIEKEYENAYASYYKEMDTVAQQAQSKETADAWAEVKDMQFNLTKKGVTNATVIAGASEFINKLDEAIAIAKSEMKEEEKYSIYDFTVDEQSDEGSDLFKNNPFMTSAFATSEEAKEIAVA